MWAAANPANPATLCRRKNARSHGLRRTL